MPDGGPAGRTPELDSRWQALLLRLCERCVTHIGVAYGSIAVATAPTERTPGVATGAVARELEQFSITTGEGPVVDAMTEHEPVTVSNLDTASAAARWPAWSGAAAARGVRAVLSLPIQAGAITAGVLTLYATSEWRPTAEQYAIAQRSVQTALLVLLDMAATLNEPALDSNLDASGPDLRALLRPEVHQAAGMIMAQAQIPIEQALARLRARAFAESRPLTDVAADVIARRVRFGAEGKEG